MGWCDQQCFAEMALDGNNVVVHDWTCRARDTAVGAYVRRWNAHRRACTGIFLVLEHANMPCIRHRDELKYAHRLSNWLQKGTNTGTLDFACCCLRQPFDSYYLVREFEEYDPELDLEVRQRTKNHRFIVGWHIRELLFCCCFLLYRLQSDS